ncbi:hypothetical protein ANCCEY_03633 [Ancylostoma ceylanicum]|uniref:Uncharacterized protein n=1 Tax=Ancylostoma ceylanicum TaxID=53326 RepID=A0A0D6MAZ0_9BILA|nr:hypothetical protein ANCCEY_03633 [Ancylostoma ceylanicum]
MSPDLRRFLCTSIIRKRFCINTSSPITYVFWLQMGREKDVSTRLIRPTIPEFDTSRLLLFVERWDPNWEHDGSIKIFDEGIAQYMLADIESHYKYMAALILSKPSLRCRLVEEEPDDILDAEGNRITLVSA